LKSSEISSINACFRLVQTLSLLRGTLPDIEMAIGINTKINIHEIKGVTRNLNAGFVPAGITPA
jgi:hypothetical protein